MSGFAVRVRPTMKTLRMNSIPKHQCGQHKIQPQNSQRRVDNGASGCPANPGRRRDGVVAVKQRNPRHRDGEHHALNQTVDQIHTPVDGILHCRPEEPAINAFPTDADQRSAPDPHGDGQSACALHAGFCRKKSNTAICLSHLCVYLSWVKTSSLFFVPHTTTQMPFSGASRFIALCRPG